VMRSVPGLAAKGRTYLPADDLARHGIALEAIFAGETSPGLEALLVEMRDEARDALREARFHLFGEGMTGTGLDERGRTAFLPLSLVEPYLGALAKVRDPLREIAEISPLTRLWRMIVWR